MTKYTVTWTIDVEAEKPLDAALMAWCHQRDPDSTATVFEVAEHFDNMGLVKKTHSIDVKDDAPSLDRAAWIEAVRMGDTLLGYSEWVIHQIMTFDDTLMGG